MKTLATAIAAASIALGVAAVTAVPASASASCQPVRPGGSC
jgi:hypothetical protein